MADNTILNAGSGGDTIRDVLKGSVKTPVCIIDVGGAGTESLLAAGRAIMSASLPVTIASDQAAVPVSGTFWQSTQPVSVASLPALVAGTAVIGHVVVDTAPITAVTGTFWQATQPVSAATLPLPAGASTEATLSTLNGKVTACNTGSVVVSTLPPTPAGTNVIGHVIVDTAPTTPVTGTVSLAPATSGGASVGRVISAASTNATSVKASSGQLYGYAAFNNNAAWRYMKLYNKASAPTVGTDTPLLTIGLPPGGGANIDLSNGVAFSLGIALALTTGMADADTGAVGAADVAANVFYK